MQEGLLNSSSKWHYEQHPLGTTAGACARLLLQPYRFQPTSSAAFAALEPCDGSFGTGGEAKLLNIEEVFMFLTAYLHTT
jgi:hypothetical protein